MHTDPSTTAETLEALSGHAKAAGVFGAISIDLDRGYLACEALESAEPAHYRVENQNGTWFVSLVTPDRWLSESIESELMHCGDTLPELIEEELIDLGIDPDVVPIEHFRDDDMLYVFRTKLPPNLSLETTSTWLLAYEAAFRPLGDMTADSED